LINKKRKHSVNKDSYNTVMPQTPVVVFDTSVVLSGLASKSGASHQALTLAKKHTIKGIVSMTIMKEALKHSEKLHLTPENVAKNAKTLFTILPAPSMEATQEYASVLSDPDDLHLLATAKQAGAHYLVTLDRRHLLKQAPSIPVVAVVSPRKLIAILLKHR